MLTALLHGGVGEIVTVCTRYYGGVKLGTGGLGRAYSGGVKLLLDSLPTQDRVERVTLDVTVRYVLDSGHVPNWNDVIRHALEWLDRYLGPVR